MTEAPCRLREIVGAMPDKPGSALHFRRDGALTSVDYPRCHQDALAVAALLRARGVRGGDRVAIHGDTSYAWVLADLGCLLAGAVSVALYPSAPPARATATAAESRCRIVFTDRAAYVAEFTRAGFEVIFLGEGGPDGVPAVDGDLKPHVEVVFQDGPAPDGPFTVVSTSGTLSEPKLFAVHSAPLLFTMDRFAELYGFGGGDRLLLYLPLSHLPQRMMLYWGLGAGMDFILSDPAHFAADTVALSPTLHVGVPRSLQHLHWRAHETAKRNGGDVAAHLRAVFGPQIRAVFVGSAATDPAVLEELLAAGVPVFEVYGTTELGMVGLNTPGGTKVGTVGRPIPWGAVRLAPETDEILVRTPTPFLHGRLVDGEIVPPETREEWAETGDVGSLDADGFLTVRGRLRDFLALSTGEKVFVRPIEEAAARATGAAECVLTKLDDAPLGALLFFDPATPGDAQACLARLAELNAGLHPWERVRRFAVVDRLPSVEDGTLTETLKIRRHKIDERYGRAARWAPVR
ncbi:AMP-binding protein [Actinocorallia sp. A-T 12471]|uniref:AMP-binding protein n=1 Tax=Actinocorallia sp. A-T 12471 TaxID=3089813 RepID=UPI0029D385D0|nr:AMP-binding protein [Actinocorallia sp. A-T 12471]MDX6742360.1 AMP-binding protein [Actinocorallia sp. A-T 12471]